MFFGLRVTRKRKHVFLVEHYSYFRMDKSAFNCVSIILLPVHFQDENPARRVDQTAVRYLKEKLECLTDEVKANARALR